MLDTARRQCLFLEHNEEVAGCGEQRRKPDERRLAEVTMQNKNGAPGCILVVEDDPGVRSMLSIILQLWGYRVVTAEDGTAATRLYRPGCYCLVMTDYSMPRMCGDELARKIREQSPEQPILMLTAHAREARGQRNPVDRILTKPPGLCELRATVRELATATCRDT
jgi:DNA-binding response OmpR family regulator